MSPKESLRLDAIDQAGRVRRRLMQAMGIAAAAGFSARFAPGSAVFAAAAQMGAPRAAFQAVAYNHINYQVADYAKVRDFYINLFGMKCVWDDGKQCSLEFGDPPNAIYLRPLRQPLDRPAGPGAGANWTEQMGQGNVDHLAFLLQLCEMELLDREKRSAQRRLRFARFPNHKTLDNFKFESQPSLNRLLVAELMRCQYIEQRASVILIGNPGTGKTHVATALAMEACHRGYQVRFYRVTELVTQLMEAREERQLLRMKAQLAKLDLLVLDELGYVPASKIGAELLFDVISTAYERQSVIVTTNLPFGQWTEVLGSERLTGAVLDRLTHRCHILEATGESYRLKDARRQRQDEAAAPEPEESPPSESS